MKTVDSNLSDRATLERGINLATSELNALRYRENPMFVVARTAANRISVSVHADDNFMFTLVCALVEKICKDNKMEPARLCVHILENMD